MIKSNPKPTGSVTHNLENNNTKNFSFCCVGSEPHIRLSNLGTRQTVVLEKTLESPLDCKEIQPVQPKGNQP